MYSSREEREAKIVAWLRHAPPKDKGKRLIMLLSQYYVQRVVGWCTSMAAQTLFGPLSIPFSLCSLKAESVSLWVAIARERLDAVRESEGPRNKRTV